MPAHGRNRPRRREGPTRESRKASRIAFQRRAVSRPDRPVLLRSSGTEGASDEQWELQCRDGWDWRSDGAGKVMVRVATFSPDRARVVQDWIERLKNPAAWWAASRELQSPDSALEVAQALRSSPWLADVLPVLLEASVNGAPPPPGPPTRVA